MDVRLIRNMGEFKVALGTWLALPIAGRTWLPFKTLVQETLKAVCGPTMRNAQMQQTANSIIAQVQKNIS